MLAPAFIDDHHLAVGDLEFHCEFPLDDVPAGRLPVMKPRDMVQLYIDLCAGLRPERIVELGIRRGGSTALLAALTEPKRLVAVELDAEPAGALSDFIAQRRLDDVVRPHYGVDQADRTKLAQIIQAEFEGEPLDLVVDDASHLFEETTSSFETLFPHVRPGGVFVIEDWSWQQVRADKITAALGNPTERQRSAIRDRLADTAGDRLDVPLTRLVLELVLARASTGDVIDEVTVGRHWVVVRRGEGHLDAASFRVRDLYRDHFRLFGAP